MSVLVVLCLLGDVCRRGCWGWVMFFFGRMCAYECGLILVGSFVCMSDSVWVCGDACMCGCVCVRVWVCACVCVCECACVTVSTNREVYISSYAAAFE